MSLEKAIKIVNIIDSDGVTKIAKKIFNFNINIGMIKAIVEMSTLENKHHISDKITKKTNDLVKWVADEIIKSKANDIYESFSEDELDFVLNTISNPIIVKLIEVITKPTDAYCLQINTLEEKLVIKLIDLIKEEDEKFSKEIEKEYKRYKYVGITPKGGLN